MKRKGVKGISRKKFIEKSCGAACSLMLPTIFLACPNSQGADGVEFSGTITLTNAQKIQLDENGFLNMEQGIIVVKDGSLYRAFSRRCPHEQGNVTAHSYLSLECERHIGQKFNEKGFGNGFRTSNSLKSYTLTNNAGTLTISS